jgi:hypothetical protein
MILDVPSLVSTGPGTVVLVKVEGLKHSKRVVKFLEVEAQEEAGIRFLKTINRARFSMLILK